MTQVKLTKNELRFQQIRLEQLNRYLPTLQLKKSLLQVQVNEARAETALVEEKYNQSYSAVKEYGALLAVENVSIDFKQATKVKTIRKHYENIAGVEIPYFEGIDFEEISYDLFETPSWVDGAIAGLKTMIGNNVKLHIAKEKTAALEKELREVSIRVNLFEKRLIPRALTNIKKIKIFLGDLDLSAVSQTKVAKSKIKR